MPDISTPNTTTIPPSPLHRHLHFHLSVMTILLCLIVLIIGGVGGYLFGKSQPSPEVQKITVVGNGSVNAQADKATVNVTLSSNASTYDSSDQQSKKDLQEVLTKLNGIGITENKIQNLNTSTYSDNYGGGGGGNSGGGGSFMGAASKKLSGKLATSLGSFPVPTMSPVYPMPSLAVPVPQGYSSTTSFDIMLDKNDIKNIEVIGQIINYVNGSTNISYFVNDINSYELQAKELAIKNARLQAENLASTNKTQIKKLISITDESLSNQSAQYQYNSPVYDPTNGSYVNPIPFTAVYSVSYELQSSWSPF